MISLQVSSFFTRPALDVYKRQLESVEIHDIKVPYITNVTADYVKSPADVKDYLTQQVSSSVRWQQTIERLIDVYKRQCVPVP